MNKRLYEQLVQEMTDGFAHHEVICDIAGHPVDYRFLSVNPAFEQLTGLQATEIIGKTVREVLPGIEPFWIETFGAVALTGTKIHFEHFSTVLGRHFDVRAYQSEPGHFVSVFSDITESRHTRESLRESEELLAKVQEIAGIGSWKLDLATNHLTWSDQVYRIFGHTPQSFAATYEAFLEAVHPDDRAAVDAVYSGSIRDGSNHYEIEHRIVRHDTGEICHVYERCIHERDATGAVVCSVGMVQDITARRQTEEALQRAEAKLHNIVTLLPQGIYEADLDGKLTYANRAAIEMFGYSETDLAAGMNVLDTVIPEDVGRMKENIGKMLRGLETENSEYTARRKDGTTFPIAIYSNVAKERETPVGLRGVLVDITKRKNYELALRQALDRAEKANRAKDEFLANISHELRTPISAIFGFAELLEETELTKEQQHCLGTINSSAETLLALVNDLLDIAKIESGHLELQAEGFGLRELIRQCVESQTPRATAKGLTIKNRIAEDVPNELLGDQLRLRQILLNLLSNAIKFTRNGEITLSVVTERCQESTVLLRLEVTDTGVGIKAENIPKIFEPFHQLDASLSRTFGGVGLGLAICKQLAFLMGGDIGVDSVEGVGSTFHLLVPFALDRADKKPDDSRPSNQASFGQGEPLRVLVAEDYEVTQIYLREVLTRHGHRADIAGSGCEAVERWRQGHYDLILMDVQMPVMDGITAVQEIRRAEKERGGHIPIIALTAHAMEEDRLDFLGKGFDGYVAKPMRMGDLFKEMKRCLDAC